MRSEVNHWRILHGDVRERLADVPDASVQCVVTSPPYWGLRDYGTAKWDGGDPKCDHSTGMLRMSDKTTIGRSHGGTGYVLLDAPSRTQVQVPFRGVCGKCGSRRIDSQLGLEPTPDAYVQSMVSVFREVRRVLSDDATVWLNLGDSYASSPPGNTTVGVSGASTLHGVNGVSGRYRDTLAAGTQTKRNTVVNGLKPKDLCGIPWRVAFALQADGWYLRSDIIWSKPNPMPESVTDRPTKAHEYVFLLTKRERYYYDAEAIKEPASAAMYEQVEHGYEGAAIKDYAAAGVQNPSTVKARIIAGKGRGGGKKYSDPNGDIAAHLGKHNLDRCSADLYLKANKRSVWVVPTRPYPEAHFATFPEKLVEPCILAGSRIGDIVLDPFAGSGTTGVVAIGLQRNFIGIELNPAYIELARKRIGSVAPLLAEERTA